MNWAQLETVLWLRWQLTRNQWAKSGGLGAVLAGIVAVSVLALGSITFLGGLAAGMFALRDAEPIVMMTVWLGLTLALLFLWLIGLITDLQRSETIDLPRLMHLPVALGQIFVVNYVVSHLAVSIVIVVPAMIGLALGVAIARGAVMLLVIPLALAMVFMVTAWTYCLRGWLAALMTNPRRRRAVIVGLTSGFILLAQLPNLYFNVIRRTDRPSTRRSETGEQRVAREAREAERMRWFLNYQPAIPPLWVPVGAQGLVEGRVWPALFGTLGGLGIGTLGLRRAYRSTLRFHQGETGGMAAARRASPAPMATIGSVSAVRGQTMLDRALPYIPEQAAAVALATFRSMLRAPEFKMQWATAFVVTLVVGAPLLFRSTPNLPEWSGPFIATGVTIFSLFISMSYGANQFGFDRDGFRAFVLSPAGRWLVLFGKNLAFLPPVASSGMVLLGVIAIWLRLSPLVFLASLLQLAAGLAGLALIGNLLSILVPYRIQPGSMRPTKMPALATLVMVLSHMSLPLALSPIFIPPLAGFLWQRAGGPPASVVNLTLSLVMAALAVFVYAQAIRPLGRLLYRRETKILSTVSVEID